MPQTVQRLVHVTGMESISKMLDQLPANLRSGVLAEAVTAGGDIMVIAAKRFAKRSERTGQLRRSIKRVTKQNKDAGTAVAIVGPVREVKAAPGMKPGKHRGIVTPSVRYAHLVEFGHHSVSGGSLRPKYILSLRETGQLSSKGNPLKRWMRSGVATAATGRVVRWVPAKPFLRPAFITTKQAVAAAVVGGISKGIEKTRAKLVQAGEHVA